MGINEDAELDPSQIEDLRGSGGGGAVPGLPGGSGALIGLIPLLTRSRWGIAVLLVGALCLGGTLLFGGGPGSIGGLGDLGGLGADTQDRPAAGGDLAQTCSSANPDRFELTECRNLLYINSVQNYWQQALPQYYGQTYRPARTRLFSGQVSTACGHADSGVGPFYCPGDKYVYIDLSFWDELARRFGAPGQFAQAYVLAHEYGHHVQTLLGTEAQVRRAQQRDPANANRYSVAMELQADCYAGVWANAATRTTDATGRPLFTEVGRQEIDEALRAAEAVGDDTIQRQAAGRVNQDAFTHGSASQRQQWFNRGYSTGDPRQCTTFGS